MMSSSHVVDQFLFEASVAVADMATEVGALAAEFRNADLAPAQTGLVRLTANLKDFVTMVGVLRGPLGIDEARLAVHGVPLDRQLARLSGWLESMIAAQESRDWPIIAHVLEHDLQPFLHAWPATLLQCRAEPATPHVA